MEALFTYDDDTEPSPRVVVPPLVVPLRRMWVEDVAPCGPPGMAQRQARVPGRVPPMSPSRQVEECGLCAFEGDYQALLAHWDLMHQPELLEAVRDG